MTTNLTTSIRHDGVTDRSEPAGDAGSPDTSIVEVSAELRSIMLQCKMMRPGVAMADLALIPRFCDHTDRQLLFWWRQSVTRWTRRTPRGRIGNWVISCIPHPGIARSSWIRAGPERLEPTDSPSFDTRRLKPLLMEMWGTGESRVRDFFVRDRQVARYWFKLPFPADADLLALDHYVPGVTPYLAATLRLFARLTMDMVERWEAERRHSVADPKTVRAT